MTEHLSHAMSDPHRLRRSSQVALPLNRKQASEKRIVSYRAAQKAPLSPFNGVPVERSALCNLSLNSPLEFIFDLAGGLVSQTIKEYCL